MRRIFPMRGAADAATAVALVGFVSIAGALVLEHLFGYIPCELCLLQRWPYYVGVPLAAVLAAAAARRAPARLVTIGLLLLALVFVVGSGLGVYHAGVEWGWWKGPTTCAGASVQTGSARDLIAQIRASRVVPCDAPAFRVLGLSLAGWNALIAAALAGVAAWGALRAREPRAV